MLQKPLVEISAAFFSAYAEVEILKSVSFGSGYEVLKKQRQGLDLPPLRRCGYILAVSHCGGVVHKHTCHHVAIECGSVELYYQIKNFLRLTKQANQNNSKIMHLGDVQIYLHNNQVMLKGELLPLTATEFKLLLVFANNLNQIVTIDKLYQEVYPRSEVKYTSRALNMHISNLRHKLQLEEFAPLRLETRRGKGFGMFYNQPVHEAIAGGEEND